MNLTHTIFFDTHGMKVFIMQQLVVRMYRTREDSGCLQVMPRSRVLNGWNCTTTLVSVSKRRMGKARCTSGFDGEGKGDPGKEHMTPTITRCPTL